MELTLLGTVALFAFIVGGAGVMLISAFRRTTELRGALIQALKRIEKLERAIATGQVTVAVTQVAAAPSSVSASAPAPTPSTEPIAPLAEPALTASPSQPAFTSPLTIDEIAAAADAKDKIDPPHIAVLALSGVLASVAALAAAHVRALSGEGGLFLALLTGALIIGAAEWRKRHDGAPQTPPRFGLTNAALTALLGIALMGSAILYGRWGLDALQPPAAVFAIAALGAASALLSLRFGSALLAPALICMALAPAQSLIQAPGAWGQYAFLAGFTALSFVLARQHKQRRWAWGAAAIALFWGVNLAIIGGAPFNVGVGGLYLAALAILGLLYAWNAAGALPFPRFWTAKRDEALLLGHALAAAAATTLAALLIVHPAPPSFTGGALLALVALSLAAGALRPGLWLAPFIAVLSAGVVIALWPPDGAGFVDAPTVLIVAAALGFLFSLGGWASMTGNAESRPGAAIAGLAPIFIFAAAYWRIGSFGGDQMWAAAALVLAGINTICALQLARTRPHAASAFWAGAAFACAASLTAITPSPYEALGLALSLPLIAAVERWRNEPGLRFAAGALCVIVLARLLVPQIMPASAGPTWLIAALFGPSAAAALLASALFTRGARLLVAAQATFALALVLMALGISLIARHAFTGGAIGDPYASLGEAGLNTLIWLGVATVLAWRLGPRPPAGLYLLELSIFAASILHAILINGALINPWWGLAPARVDGAPGLSAIEFAYVVPALVFGAYAWLRRRQGLIARSGAAFGVALVLAMLTLTLELRRLFHGADMAAAPVTHAEAWAYSAAAIGCAGLLLALAAQTKLANLRLASLALAMLALGKMAFSDLGAVEGVVRIVAFLLIAAAAGGIVFFYRRFVLPEAWLRPKTLANPNLAPPRSSV